MPNYLCSFFLFFFVFWLNTKRIQSNSEKTSIWSTLKLLRKKVWFSFSFFLFDCLITLINSVANLAILTHFEDGKEMNKESLLILFRFRYRFQRSFFSPQAFVSPIYWLWRFVVYFLVLLFIKWGKFVRGAKLSTTQVYSTQSSVKTGD